MSTAENLPTKSPQKHIPPETWENARRLYSCGHLTVEEIARQVHVAPSYLRARIESEKWCVEFPDFVGVQYRQLLSTQAMSLEIGPSLPSTDLEAITQAAMAQVSVVRQHRQDILNMRMWSYRLIEACSLPTSDGTPWPIHQQGQVYREVGTVMSKLIPLERQAFGLVDAYRETGKPIRVSISMGGRKKGAPAGPQAMTIEVSEDDGAVDVSPILEPEGHQNVAGSASGRRSGKDSRRGTVPTGRADRRPGTHAHAKAQAAKAATQEAKGKAGKWKAGKPGRPPKWTLPSAPLPPAQRELPTVPAPDVSMEFGDRGGVE